MELEVHNLVKKFDNKIVLNNVSFRFEQGKIYGLIGRNGVGKTTFFNCLSDRLRYDSGEINLIESGHKISYELKDIGFIFTEPQLPEFLTGSEFIKFFMDINKDKNNNILSVDKYFEIIDFKKEDQYKLIKHYSHGMKNKLQLLTLFILNSPIFLLDEPLTSFDVIIVSEIKNLLKKVKQNHIIIFSTHILQLAQDLCDEIIILKNGILEKIDNEMFKSKEFEDLIIDLLKDDNNV